MNNLKLQDCQELSILEMRNIEGGFICLGVCIVALAAGAAFIAGAGVGVAIYDATH